MRTAGGVLGIIGAIFGFIAAAIGFFLGVVGVAVSKAANDAYSDPTVTSFVGSTPGANAKTSIDQAKAAANDLGTWSTVLGAASGLLAVLCIVGLIGGIMAFFKPSIGAILMVIAGIGGFVLVQVFWSFSGFFLVLGALLAFLGSMQKPAARQMQPAVVPGYYPAPQPYQPQQNYYPQPQAYQQPQMYQQPQGFPAPNQYGQPSAQQYYPQQTQQAYPQPQQYYPQPSTAPQGQQVVPPQDNTKLN